MTGVPPLLIATLPAHGVAEATAQIASARVAGADLAEVRFDRWPAEERGRAAELFPSVLPLVATLRSTAEGGAGPVEAAEREQFLATLQRLPFHFIDRELDRDPFPPLRAAGAIAAHPGTIASIHLSKVPSRDALVRTLFREAVGARLRKVVIPATLNEFFSEVLPALPDPIAPDLVVLTTGPSGPLLRAWAMRLGLPVVFGSLPSSTVPDAGPGVEPSQIPVDRLRRYFETGGRGPVFGVVGRHVGRSLSPAIHSRWYREAHVNGLYIPLEAGSEAELTDSLIPLAERGFRGLNVTAPWKRAARALATAESPAVARAGCANTLTLGEDGVSAENTDVGAILRRFRELATEGRWDQSGVLVVGSGGAARATLAAAQVLGIPAEILARSRTEAKELAREFGTEIAEGALQPKPLVVHATPVGQTDAAELTVDLRAALAPGTHLVDWVYSPTSPILEALARNAGASYENGWRLLVYQAADSFEVWWGVRPTEDSLRRLVQEGPCAA